MFQEGWPPPKTVIAKGWGRLTVELRRGPTPVTDVRWETERKDKERAFHLFRGLGH